MGLPCVRWISTQKSGLQYGKRCRSITSGDGRIDDLDARICSLYRSSSALSAAASLPEVQYENISSAALGAASTGITVNWTRTSREKQDRILDNISSRVTFVYDNVIAN